MYFTSILIEIDFYFIMDLLKMSTLVIFGKSGNPLYNSQITDKKKSNAIEKKCINKKKTVYNIFLTMAEYTDDNFWKSIFIDFSQNNPRRGFTYYQYDYIDSESNIGRLVYKSKGKEYFVDISNDLKKSFTNIQNFIIEKTNIMSEIDKERRRKENFLNLTETNKIMKNSWSNIKNYDTRKLLVYNYIINFSKLNNLSPENNKKLLNAINIGISSGIFDSSNIIINDGEIVTINGLDTKNFCIEKSCLKLCQLKKTKNSKTEIESESTDITSDNTNIIIEESNCIEYKGKNLDTFFDKFLDNLSKNVSKRVY